LSGTRLPSRGTMGGRPALEVMSERRRARHLQDLVELHRASPRRVEKTIAAASEGPKVPCAGDLRTGRRGRWAPHRGPPTERRDQEQRRAIAGGWRFTACAGHPFTAPLHVRHEHAPHLGRASPRRGRASMGRWSGPPPRRTAVAPGAVQVYVAPPSRSSRAARRSRSTRTRSPVKSSRTRSVTGRSARGNSAASPPPRAGRARWRSLRRPLPRTRARGSFVAWLYPEYETQGVRLPGSG